MKINKKEFIEHLEYFKNINNAKLEDLDLSDFNVTLTKEEVEEWHFTGLDNRDFIRGLLNEN